MTSLFRRFAEADQDAANRQSQSLAALAVTLALIVVSLFLIQHLRAAAAFQDCVLSGHSWCVAPAEWSVSTR
jgi:hypothetical protein